MSEVLFTVCLQFNRVGAVIFSGFVCLGQVIFAMGANVESFPVMLAGRFVFGLVWRVCVCVRACVPVVYTCACMYVHMHSTCPVRLGGENLAVAQNAYAVTWFKEKEINMVFGLLLSVARLVSNYCKLM